MISHVNLHNRQSSESMFQAWTWLSLRERQSEKQAFFWSLVIVNDSVCHFHSSWSLRGVLVCASVCLDVCARVFMCVWRRVSRGDVRSGLAEWFSNADQLTTVLFLSSDTPSELVWGPYDALWTCVCVCAVFFVARAVFYFAQRKWCMFAVSLCVGVESLPSVCGCWEFV